ncbi:MAG: hypothetical protein PHO14_08270 [Kiritimatiellae bacterium]|jgi:predicted transcriptional regulator|nr:hypothetical protein [Kiritimatiellia bacterium]MDD4342214.1 hypothetical protein [Kiritimatiellia bacterium]MDY0149661.1 hypothetical protein [Kiritimatiellia bacterium]
MKNLNPTLWRTCKMLAGTTRIHLLRALHDHPGKCVTELGRVVDIGESAASQDLRRIQSRGLLQAERHGVRLIYRMAADPQVASAAPLLKAIQSALATFPPKRDVEMAAIATGLAHERRIRMVRHLLEEPLPLSELHLAVGIPTHPFRVHLRTLQASGFVQTIHQKIHLAVPPHPLARALIRLIRQGAAR